MRQFYRLLIVHVRGLGPRRLTPDRVNEHTHPGAGRRFAPGAGGGARAGGRGGPVEVRRRGGPVVGLQRPPQVRGLARQVRVRGDAVWGARA